MSLNEKFNRAKRRQRLYERYCRQLAKAHGVPEHIVDLLKMADDRYNEIRQLLRLAEDEAGINGLENKDGENFSQLAWDYAHENGGMPYEELICILGQFHGSDQSPFDLIVRDAGLVDRFSLDQVAIGVRDGEATTDG